MTWTAIVWHSLFNSARWMAWNLFLALVPFAISVWLFRTPRSRSLVWWVGLVVMIAFLPNAPYVLTDVIHLVKEIQVNDSLVINTLVVIPKYFVFTLIGMQAYVLSLINLGHYLQQQRLRKYVLPAELLLHGLSAIGIYLGRIERFNSWDLVTHPQQVFLSLATSLTDERVLIFFSITFLVVAGLYWLLKQVSLAVLLQRRYLRILRELSAKANSSELSF